MPRTDVSMSFETVSLGTLNFKVTSRVEPGDLLGALGNATEHVDVVTATYNDVAKETWR